MRPAPKKRIATQATTQPLGGLGVALAGIDLPDDLPPGPVQIDTPAPSLSTPAPGRVTLRRERAGRGGKTVVVVDGFAEGFTAADLEEVARVLREACGSGGAVKGRTVEVQGDQPAKVRAALEAHGFRVAGER